MPEPLRARAGNEGVGRPDAPASSQPPDDHGHEPQTLIPGYVYIVANHKKGTLYIGVTSDLEGRIYEHREGLTPGFAWKYGCTRLVWYEEYPSITDAIQREKSLKRWYRQWKIELIESINPRWDDLYETLNG